MSDIGQSILTWFPITLDWIPWLGALGMAAVGGLALEWLRDGLNAGLPARDILAGDKIETSGYDMSRLYTYFDHNAPESRDDRDSAYDALRSAHYTTALREYRARAERGDSAAQNNIGVMYHAGLGVPESISEALNWYVRAANAGNVLAQSHLGETLLGVVVIADVERDFGSLSATERTQGSEAYPHGEVYAHALKWLSTAAVGGDKVALDYIGKIVQFICRPPPRFGIFEVARRLAIIVGVSCGFIGAMVGAVEAANVDWSIWGVGTSAGFTLLFFGAGWGVIRAIGWFVARFLRGRNANEILEAQQMVQEWIARQQQSTAE